MLSKKSNLKETLASVEESPEGKALFKFLVTLLWCVFSPLIFLKCLQLTTVLFAFLYKNEVKYPPWQSGHFQEVFAEGWAAAFPDAA